MSLEESVAMVDPWHQTSIELDTKVELKNKRDATAGGGILSPSQSSPQHNTDYDSDYEKEKDLIMQSMTKAQSWVECERSRQVELLRQRREMKKAGRNESQQMVNTLVGHVAAAEEQQMKEKERQRQLINNRLEERRKQKSKPAKTE